MRNTKNLAFLLLLFLNIQNSSESYSQISPRDTSISYLKKMAVKFLEPHTNMTFSFGTEELKNEIPDLNIEIHQLKDTIKLLEELKGNYDDWNTFYEIGKLYAQFGMENNAFEYYTNAYKLITAQIQKDSLNSKYLADMGSLYMNMNNNQYAFAYYKQAYELNPQDTAAYNILPMFYIFTDDSQSAKTVIDQNLKRDPKHINSYIWYVTMVVLDKFKEDIDSKDIKNKKIEDIFDLALLKTASIDYKNDPRFPVLYNLSKLLAIFAKYAMITDDMKEMEVSKSDYSELKKLQKFFNKAISSEKFKNKYILYKALGFSYIMQKNLTKAIDNFKLAMNLWPKDKLSQDYYILFSTHYFLNGDTIKALNVIDKKIEEDKKLNLSNPKDYVLKGNVFLNMDKKTDAKTNYELALQLNLKTKDAYLGLAGLELLDNKLLESNSFINKAYELDKNHYLSYVLFGIITLMADDKQKAKEALKNALELKPDDTDIKEVYEVFFGEK